MSRKEQINDSISELIDNVNETVLTEKESIELTRLNDNINDLIRLEDSVLQSRDSEAVLEDLIGFRVVRKIEKINQNLYNLSDIQKNEGRRLVEESQKIIANSKIALQLEVGILIIIGLIIQALIFASKTTKPTFHQDQNLN